MADRDGPGMIVVHKATRSWSCEEIVQLTQPQLEQLDDVELLAIVRAYDRSTADRAADADHRRFLSRSQLVTLASLVHAQLTRTQSLVGRGA